ncbi:MAG: hypothetical protein MJ179_02885 [Treponema sp.]|nr:hypothetical protein [Treponema sp.]
MKKIKFVIAALLLFTARTFAQETTYSAGMTVPKEGIRSSDEGFAAQEFRLGVQAYYKGAFNEAIAQFEKALSYLPNDNLILEWLGNAYYRAGMEGSALSYWQTCSENGYGGLLLQNKIEIVRERRVTGDVAEKTMKLSETGSFDGFYNGNHIFSGPISILPNMDGTFWITAYNSNELLLLNLNGKVLDRITGPINGFDSPLDIIRTNDGSLLVTELAGDRIAVLDENGKFQKYIGSKGRGLGQMVGPQYLAIDYLDRIYVTDYGNRRVDVFDKDGNPLYYFGGKQPGFGGLKGPTGIIIEGDSVFVADDDYGCIFEFDRSGNYIRELVEQKTLNHPEALKKWNDTVIVCDKNKIISVDMETGSLFEYANTGNGPSRITAAAADVNNNVLVTDFTANEVYVMSKMQELVGGLFVQIENVDASKFPQVTVEVKVENRHRQPVVGLQEENFYFLENKRPVSGLKYKGSAANNTYGDITLIIDRSNKTAAYKTEVETAVKEIAAAMGGKGTLRVISASSIPSTEYIGSPDRIGNFNMDALKNPETKNVKIDLALRLAANDLINAAKKRTIIYITDGTASYEGFDEYNMSEITSYLNNNSIDFSIIQVNQGALDSELQYLIDNTCGENYYVYRPEGLSSIYRDFINIPQGVYQLTFNSTLPTNFGEKFLPLEVEVYLLNRSGRTETGYFAPLQ